MISGIAWLAAGFVSSAFGQDDAACYLPIDVMFLQDTTGSFVEDLPKVAEQIPRMVESVLAQNPNSHFGVAEFKDKPFFPLGLEGEYCYRLTGSLAPDSESLLTAYRRLFASGGGDLPEASFQALISVALDSEVGWRQIARPARSAHQTGARLLIMSTDAAPHIAGDMAKYGSYPSVPQGLPPNSGSITPNQPNFECMNQEYPTADQVVQVLRDQNVYLAVLTPEIKASVDAWKWFVTEAMGQPSEFLQIIKSDSSDLLEGVLSAIRAVTETVCALTTAPPTSAPTTDAASTGDAPPSSATFGTSGPANSTQGSETERTLLDTSLPCECPEEPCDCESPCKPELLIVVTGTPNVEYHFTK